MSSLVTPSENDPPPRRARPEPRPGHRLWFPILVGILAVAAVAYIQTRPELERNLMSWATMATILLAALLGLFWFVFLSRFSWLLRLATVSLIFAAGFGIGRNLRIDGTTDGRGAPRLVWKGSRAETRSTLPALTVLDTHQFPTAAATNTIPPGWADVPQFFGPRRDGLVTGAGLARDWTTRAPRQLWRQPIGAAWSGFAAVGGRLFTQEQRGEDECVTCYDAPTGALIWSHANRARFFQWQGGEGPRATPTVVDGRVFAFGGTGILDCLEAATGKPVWTRNVLAENQLDNLIWGVSASPLVQGGLVIVPGGLTAGPTLLAYDRNTGEPRWNSGTDKASYSSPILARILGRHVVVSFNATSLSVHDPGTGHELARHPWGTDKWPMAAQPVVVGSDRIFLSAGYGIGCELLRLKPAGTNSYEIGSMWKNMRLKAQFNSISLLGDHFYGLDDGLLACVEANTGERKWKDGRYGSGQSIVVDDLIVVQGERGEVALVDASPKGFREYGRIPALSAKTWNHPTVAGRYLFTRNDLEAVAYELPVLDR